MPEIKLNNVAFEYSNSKQRALTEVNLTIPAGSYTALVGHTGSGKSTLVSLIDGLLKPTAGQITVGKQTVDASARRQDLFRPLCQSGGSTGGHQPVSGECAEYGSAVDSGG